MPDTYDQSIRPRAVHVIPIGKRNVIDCAQHERAGPNIAVMVMMANGMAIRHRTIGIIMIIQIALLMMKGEFGNNFAKHRMVMIRASHVLNIIDRTGNGSL